MQGRSDLGNDAYHGPCPDKVASLPHRYTFTLYALSVEKLDVPADSSGAMVVSTAKEHLFGEGGIRRALRALKDPIRNPVLLSGAQSEEGRVAELLDAPRKAEALFEEIQAQSLIRPGAKESEIDESVYALAASMCGISRYWHERILRVARNFPKTQARNLRCGEVVA